MKTILKYQVPDEIQVNEAIFCFKDVDTPAKAIAYLALYQQISDHQAGIIV
jgi:hypothetical protein